MAGQEIIYLSQNDVVRCGALSMAETIADLEETFRTIKKGDYLLPPKVVLKWPGKDSEEKIGRINAMPGYLGGDVHMSGIKWIGSGPQNPFKYNLPRASALIILNDPVTMLPVAIMDGTLISAMRTGGVTGVVCKTCAPKDAATVGVIGAGIQSRTQLMAITTAVKTIRSARVYDISEERCKSFAEKVGKDLGIEIVPAKTPAEALKDVDVIVTATTSPDPIVTAKDVTKGCFYAHIGGNECTFDVVQKADKIVVDDWAQITHRGGDTLSTMYQQGLIDDGDLYARIDELVTGEKPGRENEDEIIYCNSVGLALYDLALSKRIFDYAKKNGIGRALPLWEDPIWV